MKNFKTIGKFQKIWKILFKKIGKFWTISNNLDNFKKI